MTWSRPLTLIGAPSSLGIRPYDDGTPRRLDLAPATLRDLGLVARLGACDAGDVLPMPYRDVVRPPDGVRNEEEVHAYSLALAKQVEAAIVSGAFTIVAGSDCSVVLGATLGAREAAGGAIGLVYVDGHADFATPQESITGSAASMCLAMAVGRGDTPLARLHAAGPLVAAGHVALLGRRDLDEAWYGHEVLQRSEVFDIPGEALRRMGSGAAASAALERVAGAGTRGFWIHVDADVLDAAIMPAVDSPLPDGPTFAELEELLRPLVSHPRALGMELTIYDPALDPDRSAGSGLVAMLARLFTSPDTGTS